MLRPMLLVYHGLRVVYGLIRLAAQPEKTQYVFRISNALYDLGAFDATLTKLRSNPADKDVIDHRKTMDLKDLEELRGMPNGSLGEAFYSHMTQNKLKLDFYEKRVIDNDVSFFMMRMRQTDDLWHVVTGYKTDVAGELALQAFMLAYLYVPLSVILVGGALLKVGLRSPQLLREAVDSIRQGILLGSKAQSLFSYDWTANWSTPLKDVRAHLKLQ